ncbi:MAG: hypothetical protein OCD01_04870 [Fibrobacterales bacterium]
MIKAFATTAISLSFFLIIGCGNSTVEELYKNSSQIKKQYTTKTTEAGKEIKHGLLTEWSRRGAVMKIEKYNEGLLDSVATYWFAKDKKERQLTYINGVKHGEEIWWHPNSKEKSVSQWENGKMAGTKTEWTNSGSKVYEAQFTNGLKDGIESEWFADGELKIQTSWIAGNKDGKESEWCFDAKNNGKHLIGHERHWKEGKQIKTERWYDCQFNGVLSSRIPYTDGKIHGKYVAYWVSGPYKGRVMESARYRNGEEKLSSKRRYFNPEDEKKRPRSTPVVGLTSKEKKMVRLQKKMAKKAAQAKK